LLFLRNASIKYGIELSFLISSLFQAPWRILEKYQSARNASGGGGERGDVPGWVLVVLMTAGLVTGIWTVAAPRLNLILRNSLDSINAIR
jgi:hypothetical protein